MPGFAHGADTGVGYQSDIDLLISLCSVIMQCVECNERVHIRQRNTVEGCHRFEVGEESAQIMTTVIF